MVLSLNQVQQKRWEREMEYWRHVVDGLGQFIDPGILETVVVLNLLSIRTTASCEGHLKSGCAYPWIDLGTPRFEREEQERRYGELNKTFMDLCELGPMGFPAKIDDQARRALHERDAFCQELRSAHHRMIVRLLPLLNTFYASHISPLELHLTFSEIGPFGMMRLHSVGGFFQEERPIEEKRLKLLAYQQEMRAFTVFLQGQFFQGLA